MPDEALKDLADFIVEELDGKADRYEFVNDELVVYAKTENIVPVLQFLSDNRECQFQILVDITAVDYPDREERFEVVYNLLSIRQNNRVRVKISVAEDKLVPSVTALFSSAGWYEREVWDMYGIAFAGNNDLRRILTDYGFDGHPQRKDFPLSGYVELRYSEEDRRVVYEPVKLKQDFRSFDYLSPWEGMTDVQLPGDEKGCIPPHGWVDSREATKTMERKKANDAARVDAGAEKDGGVNGSD